MTVMNAELLTPAEAAVIASVSVRDVNRAIDEKILPERFYSVANGRRVRLAACPLVGFYFRSAVALTAEQRLKLIGRFSERLEEHSSSGWQTADWTVRDEYLVVDLASFVAEADERSARLAAAREKVEKDPDILGGALVIRGTRIPVYDVVASLTAGLSHERILAAYLELDGPTLDLIQLYAEATPVRGRPRRFTALPKGASVTSQRMVRRRVDRAAVPPR